jgi:hypothetical protein
MSIFIIFITDLNLINSGVLGLTKALVTFVNLEFFYEI